MMIHEITEKVGKNRSRKRVGRGESSGLGKTSGRGHKGAKSRSGWSLPPQYQGGQINFIQKMPKRGFSNAPFKRLFHIVNVKALEAVAKSGDEINAASLAAAGLIRDTELPLKILGEGELTKRLSVTADKFSASAKAKIEAAGGTAMEVVRMKWTRNGPQQVLAKRRVKIDPAVQAAAKAQRAGKGSKGEKAEGKANQPKDGGAAAAGAEKSAAKSQEKAPKAPEK
jgi:large subunit ribosomal protein L15